jgi:hypothetical protein
VTQGGGIEALRGRRRSFSFFSFRWREILRIVFFKIAVDHRIVENAIKRKGKRRAGLSLLRLMKKRVF